ncbi:MAG: efflux RND transporter periplasmic adaptor subunit [Eubacteriales bacterium]|nr:efflux RND transporter periplasmic adaptor subunit [Eubacteriales bacterium]MDD4324224.1 efflux RND transporter periplasmic adaptor subunit [Eubacteriales bacterium]
MSDNINENTKENTLSKPRRRWLKRLIILAVVVLGIIALWRLFTPEEVVSVYQVRQVSEEDISDTLNLSGTVTPSKIQVVDYQNIPVQRFLVQAGDRVKKGDQLLFYDLSQLRSDLSELKDQREEASSALEKSQAEAAELVANAGLPTDELTAQLQEMTGDLTVGLGQLANGMLSIGNPFQQLADQFDEINFEELGQLITLMEDLNLKGDELLGVLTDEELRADLQASIADTNRRIDELLGLMNQIIDRLPEEFDITVPTLPAAPTSESTTETSTTTAESTDESQPEARQTGTLNAIPIAATLPPVSPSPLVLTAAAASSPEPEVSLLSNGSTDLSQQELLLLMQQLQSVPGGSSLLDTYQQGAELLGLLDSQIADLEQKIETAAQHERAEFDALVAEAQRDESEINGSRSLVVLFDEAEPLVRARVNRRDALLLEQGQNVRYTTDKLQLTGELVFKSPIATTSPVYSIEQSSDLMSQFMAGDQTAMLGGEPRVDIELTLEGPDLNKIIFGFDIAFEIEIAKRDKVLAVPSESLVAERGQNYVYVLNEDNSFSLRAIETGIITRAHAEIISGLDGNEWVLLNPPASLQEGVRYNVERLGE